MVERKKVFSGAPWEKVVGYSRAVRAGNLIEISGTIAVGPDGQVVGKGDAALQTQWIIEKAANVLVELGSALEHVIRTRIYVTDIGLWEEIGRVHGTFFESIQPATSMIEVKGLIGPEYLVEIEFSAL